MKDIICLNLSENHTLTCPTKVVGRTGENIATQFQIFLDECLCDYWVYLDFVKPDGSKYKTSRLNVEDNAVVYDIPNTLLSQKGVLKVQAVIQDENELVWKSTILEFGVNSSIDAVDEIEHKGDFISEAQKLLDDIGEGLTPTIGENGNWFVGKNDTGKPSRGLQGDNYEITEDDYKEIEEQVKSDIQPLLNEIDQTSDNALEVSKMAESIAKGKSQSTVFETFEELEVWLKDVVNKGTHNVGDNLYIKQMWVNEEQTIRQPDYWITDVLDEPNELGYYYNISDLGVEHPDLTNLLSKDEIKEKYLLITYEDETTETVKLVVYK